MKKFCIVFLIVFPLLGFSQKLTCADFKNGNFIMSCDQMPGDIVSIYREGNLQIETLSTASPENAAHLNESTNEILEWLGDCKYKLTYDESKGKMDDISKYINEQGGIITTIVKIEGHCCLFESNLLVNGKKMKLSGQICKNIDY